MDDEVAYCLNGDGRVAVGQRTTGVEMVPELAEALGDGGLLEHVDLLCAECLGVA